MSDAEPSDGGPSSENPKEAGATPALPAPGETARFKGGGRTGRALVAFPAASAHDDSHIFEGDSPSFAAREERPAETGRPSRDWRRLRAAASLAAVVAISAAAAVEHVHALRVADASHAQSRTLEKRLESMSAKLDSLEAGRSRDEIANVRKVLAEIKTSAASTRDVGGAVGQLASRVDRLEKDQVAKFDKLGDRIDRDSAARLADISARLEKLETKVAAKSDVAKASPGVSLEPTGAINRPPLRLRQYWLAAVRNGYAMIDSPMGEFAVSPGDIVPGGGGRVLRIERRGRDWAVVTTRGQIVAWN